MRLTLVLLALCLAACDSGTDCTDEFVRITVRVVDANGAPAKALRSTITNTRNLEAIGFVERDSTGTYTVLSDNNLAFVQRSGDVLTFEGISGDSLQASAEFTIGRQECHVARFEGPDTIVAEPIVAP